MYVASAPKKRVKTEKLTTLSNSIEKNEKKPDGSHSEQRSRISQVRIPVLIDFITKVTEKGKKRSEDTPQSKRS